MLQASLICLPCTSGFVKMEELEAKLVHTLLLDVGWFPAVDDQGLGIELTVSLRYGPESSGYPSLPWWKAHIGMSFFISCSCSSHPGAPGAVWRVYRYGIIALHDSTWLCGSESLRIHFQLSRVIRL